MSNFTRTVKTFAQMWTFLRASTATYFNEHFQLLNVANDVQRVGFNGLLIEGQSTNSLLHNRDLSDSTWSKQNNLAQAADEVGIDGAANSAHTITDNNASGAGALVQTLTGLANDSAAHTVSVFIKKTTGATVFPVFKLQYRLGSFIEWDYGLNTNTGEVGSMAQTTGTGETVRVESFGDWWRMSITAANDTSGNTQLRYEIVPAVTQDLNARDNALTGSQIIDYPQVELNVNAPTSPILTTTAAVTRERDDVEGVGVTWQNEQECSILCEVTDAFSLSAATGYIFSFDEVGVTGYIQLSITSAGVTQLSTLINGNTYTQSLGITEGDPVKIGVSIKGSEFIRYYANGSQIADFTLPDPLFQIDDLNLNKTSGSNAPVLKAYVKSLEYKPAALTRSQMESLTA